MTVIQPKGPGGIGLGFRLGLAKAMLDRALPEWDFVEVAPENYVNAGGRRSRFLDEIAERCPVVSHGLCGDLAGAAPINTEYLNSLKDFLRRRGATWYSDHLSYTQLGPNPIHDLVPLPFNEAAVKQTAERIRLVRDLLDLPVAVENISAYDLMPGGTMDEAAFVRAVLEESDCQLLLDVNNVYVNSVNIGFDPIEYLRSLPMERVVEVHVAGFYRESPDLLLDTHAMPIADPVYDLLDAALRLMPHRPPILLERDGNFPPIEELAGELTRLRRLAERANEAA